MGTLRFDINVLADTLPKAAKKDALAAKKAFLAEVRVEVPRSATSRASLCPPPPPSSQSPLTPPPPLSPDSQAEALDFAIRKKDPAAAAKKLATTKSSLDAVIAKLS